MYSPDSASAPKKQVHWTLARALSIFAFAYFALLSATWGQATPGKAWDQTLPLADEQERINVLVGIQRVIPNLFSDAVTYDRDLSELLAAQAKAEQEAKRNPEFQALVKNRGPLVDIVVANESQVSSAVQMIDPSAVMTWKETLLGALRGLPTAGGGTADQLLQGEIKRTLKSGMVGRSQGIMTGLINVLPSERRRDVFKMNYVAQVEVLKKELPTELIAAGFRGAAYGWSDPAIDPTTALARLQSARDAELHLSSLLQIQLVLQSATGAVAGKIDDVAKRLADADEGSLSVLARPDDLKREIEIYRARLVSTDADLDKPFKAALNLVAQQIRQVTSDTVILRTELDTRLILREVSPLFGIFRGFPGGDCATEYSFAYANSPAERIFYIMDPGGGVKGYLAATVVSTTAGPTLYLHTINGPHLNSADAEAAIRALNRVREQLGAKQVVIPQPSQVHSNVNFTELRSAFENLASSQSVALKYIDAGLRDVLSRHTANASKYDDPSQNTSGRLLDPKKAEPGNLNIQVHATEGASLNGAQATRADFLMMSVSLSASGRTTGRTWAEILRLGALSEQDVLQMSAAIRNVEHMPIDAFYSALKNAFSKYGVNVDKDFITRNWSLLINGHMAAPDALESKNAAQTNRLIQLAVSAEATSLLSDIMDVRGAHVLSQPKWRERFVRSESLAALLLSRLSLIENAEFTPEQKNDLNQKLEKLSPGLLAFYGQLRATRTAAEFLSKVPPGQTEKAPHIHQGVRSGLEQFLAMAPTVEQVRTLIKYMHNFDELFHIMTKALKMAKSAADFLRITDYVYAPPAQHYHRETMKFLMGRVDQFFRMDPTVDEINVFRKRVDTTENDLFIVRQSVERIKSAGDFVKLVSLYPADNSKPVTEYHKKLRSYLKTQTERFTELEPTIEELNAFRVHVWDTDADLFLMERSASKITRASDFLKMILNYKVDRKAQPNSYQMRLREFIRSEVDVFLALRPNIDEINQYRLAIFTPSEDEALMKAALERAASARDVLKIATLYGRGPEQEVTDHDRSVSKFLFENMDKFLSFQPNTLEIEEFRTRLANPSGDLSLVDYSLGRAISADEFLNLLERRPVTTDTQYWSKRNEIVAKHADFFMGFEPSKIQIDAYLAMISNQVLATQMREKMKPGFFTRLKSRFGFGPAASSTPVRCEALFLKH